MSAWPSIHEFIRRRSPKFDREAIPVPLEAIRMTEEGLGIRFPQTYVDFLCTAGELSSSYSPFMSRFNANFYDIVDRVSRGTRYPIELYWPAGLRIDLDAVVHDPFIDLARSDGEDASLVTFEPRVNFELQEPVDMLYTLAEELAANAFLEFEMDLRKFKAQFLLTPERDSFPDALEYLELFGAREVVRARRYRIWEGPDAVAVAMFDGGPNIGVEVAGEDERGCWRVIDVLRDNIPGIPPIIHT